MESRGGVHHVSLEATPELQLRQRLSSICTAFHTDDLMNVIPHSEIAGTKPPYVCPGCFIHTYSNNMIKRFQVQ
jgi:hypothetical protein